MALTQKQALQILDAAGTGKANLNVLDMGAIRTLINAPLMTEIGMFPFATGLSFNNDATRSVGSFRYAYNVTNGVWTDKTDVGPVASKRLSFSEDTVVWESPKALNYGMMNYDIQKGFAGAAQVALADFIITRQNQFLRDISTAIDTAAGAPTDFNVPTGSTPFQIGQHVWDKIGIETDKYAYTERTIDGKKLTLGMNQTVVSMNPEAFSKLIQSGVVGDDATKAFQSGLNYLGNVAGINIFVNPFQKAHIIIGNSMSLIADLDIYYAEIAQIPLSKDVAVVSESTQYIHPTKLGSFVAFNYKVL